MSTKQPAAEAELEAFRNEWRAEVSARAHQGPDTNIYTDDSRRRDRQRQTGQIVTAQSQQSGRPAHELTEDLEPKSYHDLPDKEEQLQLGNAGQNHDREAQREPISALEHYEHAVDKEALGQLGESIKHYRKAFKMDDDVHELYKRKHFPPQPKAHAPTDTPTQVTPRAAVPLHTTLQDMVKSFAMVNIEAPPPLTDASPMQRSMLGELPEEILSQILRYVAVAEVASMARLALSCKRLAYLVMTEEAIWKQVVLQSDWGFESMRYRFACDIEGKPLQLHQEEGFAMDDYEDEEEVDEAKLHAQTQSPDYAIAWCDQAHALMKSTYANSWRQMFRSRPRIRFNGCYISTVNYTRPGVNNTNTLSWGVPVHVVTYYRYLRFFRDGSVISLLTTTEPADVVHHLTKDNLHHHHGNVLPSAVMKTALRGRWRLTGPLSGQGTDMEATESEGELLVETQGSPAKYVFEMRLVLSNAGKGARNNKLAWRSYLSRNRLTDDAAHFTLKHDKGYYWSRVKSYT